ncbi:DoxX family protein [Fodinibius sp. AD559]|uniref:DoxX family protein n=1 Tax=Fodinibius sp. AD559 TaxID=3424179 RepID=UPI0040469559
MFSKIGRYLYALPFGVFGILHFVNAGQMAGMVPIPGGVFWVYLTGLAMLAACASIVIEWKARLATILLGIMLLIFVLSIHLPAVVGGEMQSSMPNLLKDLALAGGAWFIAGQTDEEITDEI